MDYINIYVYMTAWKTLTQKFNVPSCAPCKKTFNEGLYLHLQSTKCSTTVTNLKNNSETRKLIAQSAGAVEYTDCTSAEG